MGFDGTLFFSSTFLHKGLNLWVCVVDNICRSPLFRSIKMGFNQGNAEDSIRNRPLQQKEGVNVVDVSDVLRCNGDVIRCTET